MTKKLAFKSHIFALGRHLDCLVHSVEIDHPDLKQALLSLEATHPSFMEAGVRKFRREFIELLPKLDLPHDKESYLLHQMNYVQNVKDLRELF